MKKIYYVICDKYRQLKTPKIYIFKKTVLSNLCSKQQNEDEKIFKEEESIDLLKILGLIKSKYNYFKNMEKENASQEFRLKIIDKVKIIF